MLHYWYVNFIFDINAIGHRYWSCLMPQDICVCCAGQGQSSVFCCHHVWQELRDTIFCRDRACVTGPGQLLALRPNRGWAKNPRQVRREQRRTAAWHQGPGQSQRQISTGKWSPLTRLFWSYHDDFCLSMSILPLIEDRNPHPRCHQRELEGGGNCFWAEKNINGKVISVDLTILLNIIMLMKWWLLFINVNITGR